MRQVQSSRKARKGPDRTRGAFQSFDSLITTQQERINDTSTSRAAFRQQKSHEQLNAETMYEDEEMEIPIEEMKEVNADKMSILVGQLLAKNKINAKNAFEVPMILLNETCAFSETSSDTSWKRLSSTLESNNKIYGYRVDATHNYTYRVLEFFTRQEKPEGEEREEQDAYKRERQYLNSLNSLNSQFVCNDPDDCYAKHLQKNFRNINILHLETFFNVNPVLQKTKRIFDQNGLSALLLNNLEIRMDLSLRISLIQQTNIEEIKSSADENLILCELECGQAIEYRNIFRKIESVCQIHDLMGRRADQYTVKRENNEMELLWTEFEAEYCIKSRKRMIKVEEDLRESIHVDQFLHPASNTGSPMAFETQFASQTVLQSNQIAVQQKRQDIGEISPTLRQQSSNSPACALGLPFDSANPPPQIHEEAHPQQCEVGNILEGTANQSQLALSHVTPANTSNISDEPSFRSHMNLSAEAGNQVQISDYIKMSRLSLSTDLILREIDDFETGECGGGGGEKNDLVSQWKNSEAVVRKKRTPREKQPASNTSVDFLNRKDGVTLSRRREVLCLDKKKRKQFKSLLKKLGMQAFKERNCLVNTKDWRMEVQLKTFLTQYHEPGKEADAGQNDANLSMAEGRTVIDLEAEGENRWATMKRNTSIREAKEIIKSHIDGCGEELSFASIYSNFVECDSLVSPALCFLTVLHLANENNYSLDQLRGEFNFIIKRN